MPPLAILANGYSVASLAESEMDTAYGQYALCNGLPGQCSGGNELAVGKESAFGAVGARGGQCGVNAVTGSWYTLPLGGRCAAGDGGDGCTWREVKRVKTIALTCLLNNTGLVSSCAAEKLAPFAKSTTIFETAFASDDPTAAGCPDVCHALPACKSM